MSSPTEKNSKDIYTTGNLGDTSKNWFERNWLFLLLGILLFIVFLLLLRSCDKDDMTYPYDPVQRTTPITPPNWGAYNPPQIPLVPIDRLWTRFGRSHCVRSY